MAAWVTPASAADTTTRLDVGLVAGVDPADVVDRLTSAVVRWSPVEGLDALTVDISSASQTAVLAQLAADSRVRFAERSATVRADSTDVEIPQPGGLDVTSNRRWLDLVQVPSAWTWTLGSPSVTVAVVDSGVSPTAELGVDRLAAGRDFVDGDTDASDDAGHGTAVAAVIAGERDNNVIGAGICSSCRIMPVRVLSRRAGRAAEGTSADVAAGIVWAADHGAQVINLSLSTPAPSRLLSEAVRHAAGKGAVTVGSAGQTGTSARQYPAAVEPVIAVGAIDEYGSPSSGTNRNVPSDRWIDVSAPDVSWSAGQPDTYPFIGSSVSTAIVSGVAALAVSERPEATAAEIRAGILGTTDSAVGHTSARPADARVLNAARAIRRIGRTADTHAPQITGMELVDGQVVNSYSRSVRGLEVFDDHGIDRMELVVGGKVVDSIPAAPWAQYLTLTVPAGHSGNLPVTVRAVDYAGNVHARTVTVRVDRSGPTGAVLAPAHRAHVRTGPVKVVFAAAAKDVVAVQINDGSAGQDVPMTRIAGTDQWTATVSPLRMGPQWGDFVLTAWDRVGNMTDFRRSVVVDDEGPAVATISPASKAKVRGTFTTRLTGVTDPSGVAKAELWANGKLVGRNAYTFKVNTGRLSGNVRLVWRLTDKLGNVGSHTRTVIADNKAPTVSITRAPKHKAKVKGTVRVSVKATDTSGVARVELIVNGKVVARDTKAGYVLSFNAAKQKKTMRVQVRAYDRLGNVKYTSARTWYRK